MSALTSASTRAELLAAYEDNASYEAEGSLTKCRDFITACRMLLSPRRLVARVSHGGRQGEEVEVDLETFRAELTAAREWLAAAAAADSGGVIHADFTGFRE